MNKYNSLDSCIKQVYELSSNLAKEGVKTGTCGPFGAGIILKQEDAYKIITINHNTVVKSKDPTAHAELNAIRDACKILNTNDLSNCILVSTSKSCPMCLSAAVWANIKTIYYSANYKDAKRAGFKDEEILKYLKGKKGIIKEIRKKENICDVPFKAWENSKNKIEY